MYFVYVLKSVAHDKFYVGQTNNVENRLNRHNAGYENFTSKYHPWQLVLQLQKDSRAEAMILEKKLKNLSRERLNLFIEKYQ